MSEKGQYDVSRLEDPKYDVSIPSTRYLCWTYADYFRGAKESLESCDNERANFQLAYLRKIAEELERRDPVAFTAWKHAMHDHENPERFFSNSPDYAEIRKG